MTNMLKTCLFSIIGFLKPESLILDLPAPSYHNILFLKVLTINFYFYSRKIYLFKEFAIFAPAISLLISRSEKDGKSNMVVVAQLVRVLVCGTEGRGFEPRLPPEKG